MSCIDVRPFYAYSPGEAVVILEQTRTLVQAQEYLCYWDRATDKVHSWKESSGIPFNKWLADLGGEAVSAWQIHSVSSANHVRYNGNQWGTPTWNCRGQYLIWPGGVSSAWIDSKVAEVWEIPRSRTGVTQIGESGVPDTGAFACWWYAE